MPIYEFECRNCGTEFEQMQSFSATTTPACVRCGSEAVVRRIGRPAIHFKGSGWYITDSKKNSASAASNGEHKSAEKSSDAPAEKSASSKSATEAVPAD